MSINQGSLKYAVGGASYPNFSGTPQKCAQHVLRFPELPFSSTRLVKLLLWLDNPRLLKDNEGFKGK